MREFRISKRGVVITAGWDSSSKVYGVEYGVPRELQRTSDVGTPYLVSPDSLAVFI